MGHSQNEPHWEGSLMEDESQGVKIVPTVEPPTRTPPGKLEITPAMQEAMRKTQASTRFLAIVGLSFAGLCGVIGLGIAAMGLYAVLTDYGAHVSALPYATMVFGASILTLGCAIPSIALLRCGREARRFAREETGDSFLAAIFAQRCFWRTAGIVTIIAMLLNVMWMLLSPAFQRAWSQLY